MADPVEKDHVPFAMDVLTKKVGRFALTAVVAKRAREIKERQSRRPDQDTPASPVVVAIQDIVRGRAKIIKREPDEHSARK
jgi:DNA-directed RNA polymerase subunit K/omega